MHLHLMLLNLLILLYLNAKTDSGTNDHRYEGLILLNDRIITR